MNKAINVVLVGFISAVLSTAAMAGGNNNGNNNCRGNCGGSDKGGSQTQKQGQSTEVGVRQDQNTRVQVSNDSRSSSQSASQAQSTSSSQGGSVNFVIPEGGLVRDNRSTVNTVSIPEGAIEARGGAGGNARGGEGGAGGVGGQAASSSEGGDSYSEGGNAVGNVQLAVSADSDYDVAAAQASSVYTQACQTGARGQVEGGGFNVVSIDAFCQRVDAARVWLEVHAYADRHGDLELAEHAGVMYMHNINEAQELVDYDEYPAKIDNFFSRFIKPVAVIAALILII